MVIELTMQLHFSQNMIAGFNDGNETMVGRWYKSYYPDIEKRVRQLTHGSPDAADLASKVVLIVIDNKGEFKSLRNIENFTETIIVRTCQAEMKKKKERERKMAGLTDYLNNLESEAVKKAENRKLVDQLQYLAMEMLPPQCRQVFQLYYLQGMKNREIAERLGISEKAVEAHKTLAFKKLKLKIIDLYGGGLEMFLIIISLPLYIIYLLMQKLLL